ncbi:MAG TPA: ferritin-like domain-containing protein [Roseiflexaceae bacterium]|nr:ferritin-like domain-containing protein [Roseiflexaceae bacterium]
MKLNTLQDLLIEELQDIYDAENQILKALPNMAKAASAPQLQQAFEEHLRQTQTHVQRLDQVFQQFGAKSKGKTCKAMQGLIAEGEEMIKERADPAVRDAGLISAAQRVEHYEMAAYGTVRTYARQLGPQQAAQLLQQTLDEEGMTDKRLTMLAESLINLEAERAS